jgi:hypothetical protein
VSAEKYADAATAATINANTNMFLIFSIPALSESCPFAYFKLSRTAR